VFFNLGSAKIFLGSAKKLKVRLNMSLGVLKSNPSNFFKSYIFDQFLRSFTNMKRNFAKNCPTPPKTFSSPHDPMTKNETDEDT
jgi:hypothetical protein